MDTPAKKSPRKRAPKQEDAKHVILNCSFCGKSQHEVHKLIAGPAVIICDECVSLCNDIIAEEDRIAPQPPATPPTIEQQLKDLTEQAYTLAAQMQRLHADVAQEASGQKKKKR